MKTQELFVSYRGSGVKTLNGFGVFFFVIGSLALLTAIIGGTVYLVNIGSYYSSDEALVGASLAGAFFPVSCVSLFAGAVCTGLSSIAKVALYKRIILEQQYFFKEPSVSTNWYDKVLNA
jgi:hypothetical protein